MRKWGQVPSPTGLAGESDHLCWGYTSPADRRDAVLAWLHEGLSAGQHAWYVAAGTRDELIGELAALPDRDERLANGTLRVDAAEEVYGEGTIHSEVQLSVYDRAVDAAVARGATGLRVAADVTALVADPARRPGHLRWEHVSERYAARRPFSAMCMYDRIALGDEASAALVCLHPLRRDGDGSAGVTVLASGGSLALAGEADGLAVDTLREVLELAIDDADESIDVSQLRFVDGRSAAVIHDDLSRRKRRGQVLRLVGAPAVLRRVWELCRFDQELLAG